LALPGNTEGRRAFSGRRQRPWASRLARRLDAKDIHSAGDTVETIRRKLELAVRDELEPDQFDGSAIP
jgi:hypothetical protein